MSLQTKHTPSAAIKVKARDMIKLMNIHLNHFPNHEKYGLCQSIRNCAYEIYGLIIECEKRYHTKTSLTNLDIKHEQLRMFVNLAFELKYYNYKTSKRDSSDSEALRRYTALSVLIDDLGKMIGGWIKYMKEQNA